MRSLTHPQPDIIDSPKRSHAFERLLCNTRHRVAIALLAFTSLFPNSTLANSAPAFPISQSSDLKDASTEKEIPPSDLLKVLDYRKIDQLNVDNIDDYIGSVKSAVDSGKLDIGDLKSAIFPDNSYSFGLFVTDLFAEKILPKTIDARKSRNDHYARALRPFLPKMQTARKHHAKHEAVFKSYINVFGSRIDLTKTHRMTDDWDTSIRLTEEWLPRNHHGEAIDIYFDVQTKEGREEIGPPIRSYSSGVVVASGDGWSGDGSEPGYLGGGLTPMSGNGVIIYNPIENSYYYYIHFYKPLVQTGDIVESGQILGIGGNTGNARLGNCGRHVHFEIHTYNPEGDLKSLVTEELFELLTRFSLDNL